VARIVVKERQAFDPCLGGHIHHVVHRAVPPAGLAADVLLLGVLRVVNQQVGASHELDVAAVALVDHAAPPAVLLGSPEVRAMRLVIGGVDNAHPAD
jgi:hypothetical protein